MRLTDLTIKSLKPSPKGQRLYVDDTVAGFGVRVSPGGTMTYVLMYGAERSLKTIGRVGIISLAEARRTAKQFLAAKTLGKHTTPSIGFPELREEFLHASARKHKPRTTAEYKRLLNRVKFGNVADINPRDISTTVAKFTSPAEANHILTALKAIFTFAVQRHYLTFNPARALPLPSKHTPRDRVLSPDELKAVWKALKEDRFSKIVKLLILTGQRRSEIAAIKVHDGKGVIDASFTKNRLKHVFPMAQEAIELLENEMFFNGWGKAKNRLDKESGVTNWTLHDLRRTYATNHAQIGTPVHVIERLLNHISGTLSGVAGIYNRYSYESEMAKAVAAYTAYLRALVGEPVLP